MARRDVCGIWVGGGSNILLSLVQLAMATTLVWGVAEGRTQIATCGDCTFWLDGERNVNATLSSTGSCEDNCIGWLFLGSRGIVSIKNGTFHRMPKLQTLYLSNNALTSIPADASSIIRH